MELYSSEYKQELEREWREISKVMANYPHIFPPSKISSSLFYKFYAQVCTRCFGWGVPSTSMVPMADNINHSDVTVVQEMVCKRMHLEADRESKYFTKTKFMNDYSICFNESEYASDAARRVNVKGRFSKANFEANKQFEAIDKLKSALENNVQLWDVPCIRERYTEDNDTEDENEERMSEKAERYDIETFNSINRMVERCRKRRKGFMALMAAELALLNASVREVKKKKAESATTTDANAPKEFWEIESLAYKPITEWTLQNNEWHDPDSGHSPAPYTPKIINFDEADIAHRQGRTESDSEETDEEFDWFNPREHGEETYFTFVNKNRKAYEVGD